MLDHLLESGLLEIQDHALVQAVATTVAQALLHTYTGNGTGGNDDDRGDRDGNDA